jgi:hypothetical protein
LVSNAYDIRTLIGERLAFLADPRFEFQVSTDEEHRGFVGEQMAQLQKEKRPFFERHDYEWAFKAESYNSAFEALLQWRLLNVLSDISADHPALDRCGDLVVRVVPTSCARPHLRQVEQFRVIVLTQGYLSAFKGFIRLWLRGCALGQDKAKREPATYRDSAACYASGIFGAEDAMALSAKAYLGRSPQARRVGSAVRFPI